MKSMIEQVKDATTPEEMRAEIFHLQHHDPLVRSVMDAANYCGMSAEDRYTVLAYNALKAKTHAQAQMLEWVRISPSPRILMTPNAGVTGAEPKAERPR